MTTYEVTNGTNGYPMNVYHVDADFESWEEAEQYANDNNGEVVLLHRKDGWDLWECKGKLYEPVTRSAEDEGDDYMLYSNPTSAKETLMDNLKEDLPYCDSIDDMLTTISKYQEIIDELDCIDEGEAVLTLDGRFHSVIELHPMHWHDTDNNEYIIAVRDND